MDNVSGSSASEVYRCDMGAEKNKADVGVDVFWIQSSSSKILSDSVITIIGSRELFPLLHPNTFIVELTIPQWIRHMTGMCLTKTTVR
jgi:hypothetical protein